jgi:eukaryotic-like serine/threonine-protein kinase
VTSERWKRVEAVFEQALELPQDQRAAFLQENCNSDAEVRREVEALLNSHERAGNFIDQPSLFFADDTLRDNGSTLQAGELIGSYRIVRELGRGGMGAVYLAERADEQYKKRVAIKLIKRGMDTDAVLRHFRNERQILASFDHPNIARLFDGGTTADGLPYFVMECVEGLPIDKYCDAHKLSVPERLKLFREICAAVSYAHHRGVVHRDIKPSNIVVTTEGVPKLLDFGIAKILQPPAGSESLVTLTGLRPMTPHYASPEQVRGEAVTTASDIYSLGVVLFELLTGHLPYRFASQAPHDVARAITEQEPTRPSTVARDSKIDNRDSGDSRFTKTASPARTDSRALRGDIDNILLTALRKEPARRYQSVEEFADDIRRHLEARPVFARKDTLIYRAGKFIRRNPVLVGAASVCSLLVLVIIWLARPQLTVLPPAPQKSIAVLPFQNLSADPGNAYLADGIQEEILTRLSKIADLKVISRTSTQRYKDPSRNLREIAKQLGVAHILEGTVQKAADQVRVNVQLINAQTDAHLWADKFDRKVADIFSAESEIATKIAQTLQAKLTGSEQRTIAASQTQNSEAHELYLKGRFFMEKRTADDLKKAIELFKQALAKDPNYAAAYAGMADVYVILPIYVGGSAREAIANARAAAEKALAIDDELAEAHSALGFAFAADFDWHDARREFERAIQLDPNFAGAHYCFGFYVFGPLGDLAGAIAEMKRAIELDPLSTNMIGNLGYCYIFARRYPEAIAAGRKAVELDPRAPKGNGMIALGLDLSGQVSEAIAQYEKAFEVTGGDYHFLPYLSRLYGLRGERAKALQISEQAKQIEAKQDIEWAYGYALVAIGQGDYEEAINWLERSYRAKELLVASYFKFDPVLDPLRGNPRFEKLLQQIDADFTRNAETPTPQKSIAVLPFENLSDDPKNAYFADGIQEEILTRLSKIADLKVISRTSTQRYKNTSEPLSAIAEQLGVAHVVEGTVQKAADQVRVNVQLINAQTDAHLWADKYDRKLTDIFSAESEIATKIAETLQAKLSGSERRAIAAHPTKNTEAHDLYLKGRYQWRNFYASGYERVREYFEQAIALDPSYAPAYAGLSTYHAWAAANGIFAPDHWPLAEEALRKAFSLDETLPEAYNALAAIEVYYKRDWPAAERAFRRGIELDPNFGDLPDHYGLCLAYVGRFSEAIEQNNRALELDPFFPGANLQHGTILFFSRDYERAAAQFAKTLEMFPDNTTAHERLGEVCAKRGMTQEAITHWCAALNLNGQRESAQLVEETFKKAGFDAAVRALGQRELQELDRKRARGEYVAAAHYVFANLRCGNIDEAFQWLPKMLEEPNWFALQFRVNPVLDPLRSDPRFEKIASSVKFNRQ